MVRYVITDGKHYMRCECGKYIPVKDIFLSEKFDNLCKATRILNSSINKKKGKKYFVKEITENTSIRTAEKPDVEAIKTIINSAKVDASIDEIAEKVGDIREDVVEIEARRDFLIESLSVIDRQLTDIRHFIEFNDYEVCDQYDVFRLEKVKYSERRAVKDEIHIINALQNGGVTTAHFDSVMELVEKMRNRKYTPRILESLFIPDDVKKGA